MVPGCSFSARINAWTGAAGGAGAPRPGLVGANRLADAGWCVLVLEQAAEPGGAVRTAEVTAPGFRNDLFSAFYPMTAASPVIAELTLEQFGLAWTHAPKV